MTPIGKDRYEEQYDQGKAQYASEDLFAMVGLVEIAVQKLQFRAGTRPTFVRNGGRRAGFFVKSDFKFCQWLCTAFASFHGLFLRGIANKIAECQRADRSVGGLLIVTWIRGECQGALGREAAGRDVRVYKQKLAPLRH